ncbi:MAG: hypothetical protein K9N49_07850, partial [Candidatus Marinimicrobia bacterium]|nr:hypothetical protein [Candidatus Neomarinimicrobiota bacterium]
MVTAGLGVGCGDQYEVPPGTVTPEDARRESAEAVATTAKLAEQTRAEYINQVKAEMAATGKRFDTLHAETQALGRQAGEASDDRLAQLADNRQA